MKKNVFFLSLFVGIVWLEGSLRSQPTAAARTTTTQDLTGTVNAFLNLLSDDLRAQAVYPFENEERYNWHFVPRSRKGLPLKAMNEPQRKAAMEVLRVGLSEQGYAKAKAIIDLENVLKEIEKRGPEDKYRDPENYSFTVFGSPSNQEPWGWRIEGHHLSLNFSSVNRALVSGTPGFMGSNPGIVPSGPQKGKQILKQEADVAFSLLKSFSPSQLKKVIIADKAPNEIITGNSRKAVLDESVGLSMGEMNASQKKIFSQLLDVYLRNYHKTLADSQMEQLEKAGLDKLLFAWAGSTDRSTGHYYRIHGPTLLIEFDNTQNDANHVHTVVRDLKNDFGEDLLREHYKQHAHEK